jgi:hypothetical protein
VDSGVNDNCWRAKRNSSYDARTYTDVTNLLGATKRNYHAWTNTACGIRLTGKVRLKTILAIWNKKFDTIDGTATNRKMRLYWGGWRNDFASGSYLHPTYNLRTGMSYLCASDGTSNSNGCNGVVDVNYKNGNFLLIEWAYRTEDTD